MEKKTEWAIVSLVSAVATLAMAYMFVVSGFLWGCIFGILLGACGSIATSFYNTYGAPMWGRTTVVGIVLFMPTCMVGTTAVGDANKSEWALVAPSEQVRVWRAMVAGEDSLGHIVFWPISDNKGTFTKSTFTEKFWWPNTSVCHRAIVWKPRTRSPLVQTGRVVIITVAEPLHSSYDCYVRKPRRVLSVKAIAVPQEDVREAISTYHK